MAQRSVEALNLVTKLGSEEMLDLFEEWLWPIFQQGQLKGRGETQRYEFLGCSVSILNNGMPVLYGRLIKILQIEAEQDIEKQELVRSSKTLSSVPSSFFVLDLASHKMSFLRETRRAPTSKEFEFVLKRLFKKAWDHEYSRRIKEWLEQENRERLPRNRADEIRDEVIASLGGFPEVRLKALSSVKELEKKIAAFGQITKVSLGVLSTNNEIADEYEVFLRACQNQKKEMSAEKVKVEIAASKTGLDKVEVSKLMHATADGNFTVRLDGKSKSGARMSTDLEEATFRSRIDVPTNESSIDRARRLFGGLQISLNDGMVLVRDVSDEIKNRALELAKRILGE